MSGTSGSISIPATLSVAIPLSDGVADTRVGSAGAVGQYSDSGHIHPITRMAQVTLPAIATTATLTGQVIWAQGTNEEEQFYNVRLQITPIAAGRWTTFTFPLLPGYQTPQITLQGVYYPGIATSPSIGENFIWGSTTMYWNVPALFVSQACYLNFAMRYALS